MNSILTNGSAISALQTLRHISSDLSVTQNMVSSGLRVGKAADNAAYWSISTTMRSDRMAISAVSDALGLGAAKVDTAYAATSAITDLLSSYKARLVAATEQGVDRAKIQEELKALNAQIESVVASASFSGINWLKTNEANHLMEAGDLKASLVSSFVRAADNGVSVKTMQVDLKATSMLNRGGGGILQKELGGIGDIGGFRDVNFVGGAHNGHEARNFTGPATFEVGDFIDFDIAIDWGDHSVGVTPPTLRIDRATVDAALGTTDGTINDAIEMRRVLQKLFDDNAVPAWTIKPSAFTAFTPDTSLTQFEIGSRETSGEPGSSVEIFNVTSNFGAVHPAGFALGLEGPPANNHDNMYPKAILQFSQAFTIAGQAEIYFDVQIGNGAIQTITIDRASIDAALGTSDGVVAGFTQFAQVIAYASAGSGMTAISTDLEFPGVVTMLADQAIYPEAGNRAIAISIGNVRTNIPWTLDFDLAEIDITGSAFSIDEYITGVEYMLQRTISSGGTLGALQARLEMQTEFAAKMMSTMDSGIGRLVDADMNEASTRLKALQTQQQLATQALSIANSSAETMLQLFR